MAAREDGPWGTRSAARPPSHDSGAKRPFDIDAVMRAVRRAVKPFPRAALFELRDEGYASTFEQLAACLISIRTRDEVTLPTARRLFAAARTPAAVAALTPEAVDELIHACAFHAAKAAQIHAIARRCVDAHGGALPCDEALLLDLPGVGPKCANLVLGIACGAPKIGVDIHVHRVTNRWGYVAAATPEGTMKALQQTLPPKYHVEINERLVPFGKHVCTGRLRPMASVPRVPYHKRPLSSPELMAHLRRRGLRFEQVPMLDALEYIGYFRLLSYMRPLQWVDPATGVKRFKPGTTLEDVLTLYEFDRQLRLLCLDAVERIEVALRAAIIGQVSIWHGSHFHLDPANYDGIAPFVEFYQTVSREDRHVAVKHYRKHYCDPEQPPIWTSMEALTFGALSRLFSGLALHHRKMVARRFGYDESVLSSWFRAANLVRNLCAHHGRLWNAPMHIDQPVAAKKLREEMIPTDRLYARLVLLGALVEPVGRPSNWKRRLIKLFLRYPSVPLAPMGIPDDWLTRRFWVFHHPDSSKHRGVLAAVGGLRRAGSR